MMIKLKIKLLSFKLFERSSFTCWYYIDLLILMFTRHASNLVLNRYEKLIVDTAITGITGLLVKNGLMWQNFWEKNTIEKNEWAELDRRAALAVGRLVWQINVLFSPLLHNNDCEKHCFMLQSRVRADSTI